MEVVPPQYDDGLEMEHYQGLEVIGDASDEFEKTGFYTNERIYDEDPRSRLKRELKTRQLAMIALGGALGTGLIVNTGPTLARVGPGSMIIGYALVGVLCYAVMAAMVSYSSWMMCGLVCMLMGRRAKWLLGSLYRLGSLDLRVGLLIQLWGLLLVRYHDPLCENVR